MKTINVKERKLNNDVKDDNNIIYYLKISYKNSCFTNIYTYIKYMRIPD